MVGAVEIGGGGQQLFYYGGGVGNSFVSCGWGALFARVGHSGGGFPGGRTTGFSVA